MFNTVNRILIILQIAIVAIVTYVITIYILPLPADEELVDSACAQNAIASDFRTMLLASCNSGELDCNVQTLNSLQNAELQVNNFKEKYCPEEAS